MALVIPIQEPTQILGAVYCHIVSRERKSLVLAKNGAIEVYNARDDSFHSLRRMHRFRVGGPVTAIAAIRPEGSDLDILVFSMQGRTVNVVSYDPESDTMVRLGQGKFDPEPDFIDPMNLRTLIAVSPAKDKVIVQAGLSVLVLVSLKYTRKLSRVSHVGSSVRAIPVFTTLSVGKGVPMGLCRDISWLDNESILVLQVHPGYEAEATPYRIARATLVPLSDPIYGEVEMSSIVRVSDTRAIILTNGPVQYLWTAEGELTDVSSHQAIHRMVLDVQSETLGYVTMQSGQILFATLGEKIVVSGLDRGDAQTNPVDIILLDDDCVFSYGFYTSGEVLHMSKSRAPQAVFTLAHHGPITGIQSSFDSQGYSHKLQVLSTSLSTSTISRHTSGAFVEPGPLAAPSVSIERVIKIDEDTVAISSLLWTKFLRLESQRLREIPVFGFYIADEPSLAISSKFQVTPSQIRTSSGEIINVTSGVADASDDLAVAASGTKVTIVDTRGNIEEQQAVDQILHVAVAGNKYAYATATQIHAYGLKYDVSEPDWLLHICFLGEGIFTVSTEGRLSLIKKRERAMSKEATENSQEDSQIQNWLSAQPIRGLEFKRTSQVRPRGENGVILFSTTDDEAYSLWLEDTNVEHLRLLGFPASADVAILGTSAISVGRGVRAINLRVSDRGAALRSTTVMSNLSFFRHIGKGCLGPSLDLFVATRFEGLPPFEIVSSQQLELRDSVTGNLMSSHEIPQNAIVDEVQTMSKLVVVFYRTKLGVGSYNGHIVVYRAYDEQLKKLDLKVLDEMTFPAAQHPIFVYEGPNIGSAVTFVATVGERMYTFEVGQSVSDPILLNERWQTWQLSWGKDNSDASDDSSNSDGSYERASGSDSATGTEYGLVPRAVTRNYPGDPFIVDSKGRAWIVRDAWRGRTTGYPFAKAFRFTGIFATKSNGVRPSPTRWAGATESGTLVTGDDSRSSDPRVIRLDQSINVIEAAGISGDKFSEYGSNIRREVSGPVLSSRSCLFPFQDTGKDRPTDHFDPAFYVGTLSGGLYLLCTLSYDALIVLKERDLRRKQILDEAGAAQESLLDGSLADEQLLPDEIKTVWGYGELLALFDENKDYGSVEKLSGVLPQFRRLEKFVHGVWNATEF